MIWTSEGEPLEHGYKTDEMQSKQEAAARFKNRLREQDPDLPEQEVREAWRIVEWQWEWAKNHNSPKPQPIHSLAKFR